MAEPWEVPPNPLEGCTLVDDVVINVDLFIPGVIGRSYGELLYGDEVYGDVDGDSGWSDISDRVFGVEIVAGAADGTPFIPVPQATINVHDDPDDPVFPMDPKDEWPYGGTVCRVSLSRPTDLEPLPVFVGRIEAVYDDHNDTIVRDVTVQAFGMISDLAVTPASYSRPAENTLNRLNAIVDPSTGWWWDLDIVSAPSYPELLAFEETNGITYRQALDNCALSASTFADQMPDGRIRTRYWPLAVNTPAETWTVTDCTGETAIASPSIVYVADATETLNNPTVAQVPIPPVDPQDPTPPPWTVTLEDSVSIDRVGRKTNGVGFPLTGLHTSDTAELTALCQLALDHHSKTVVRVESFEIDTSVDSRWSEMLPDLDTGHAVSVIRTGMLPTVTIDGRICGYTLRLVRGRATATVELTTTTTTIYTPSDRYLSDGADELLDDVQQLTDG